MSREFVSGLLSDLSPDLLARLSPDGGVLVNSGVGVQARRFCRVGSLNGLDFLLLPVPHLFNHERGIEAGFAVEASVDNFDVYAYMFNYDSSELLVLPKLPHCVHKAIKFDGSDYSSLDSEVVSLANRDSALLFINNYLSDSVIDFTDPFELFDNKLYQQLINRLVTIKDSSWCSDSLIDLRLSQLLSNFDSLDEHDSLYANNLSRANLYLSNFLFGCEDNISNKGFFKRVNPDKLKPYVQGLYESLFTNGFVCNARDLMTWSGIKPDFSESIIQSYYNSLFSKGWINTAHDLMNWSGIRPVFSESVVQSYYESLFSKGWISDAIDLMDLSGIKPAESIVQSGYESLFSKGWISDVSDLMNWSGIKPAESIVQSGYESLFSKDLVRYAHFLMECSGIKPNNELIKKYKLDINV